MFRFKIAGLLISLQALFHNISFDPGKQGFVKGKSDFEIRKVSRISPDFTESSGLEIYRDGDLITLRDSGNEPFLYVLSTTGEIKDTISTGLVNKDWESMAADDEGGYYIGDIGNNANRRKDLKVYKYKEGASGEIRLNYADQKGFPPSPENKNFDCEAMFWYADSLHLITKNRGSNQVKYYKLPAEPGSYSIAPIDSIILKRQVTGADIDPQTGKMYLLSYGMIYIFNSPGFKEPYKAVKFTRSGQAEGLVSKNGVLYITNESGKLFRVESRE